MAERFNAAVLKTVVPERVPGVRIPLPPPFFELCFLSGQRLVGTGLARVAAYQNGGIAGDRSDGGSH